MANNIIKRVWNQGSMTPIEDLQGSAFTNENGGHTFQISGVDSNGEALALSGTVAASFLRPDQTTVGISGSVSGGVASVTLSAECYGVPGRFGLVVFLTSDGKKTAIYSCVGNVARSSTDAVAPGVVADVVDLINEIQAAVDTIPASYSALMADIAPTYSSSALYAVGDYAWYEGDLKRCIVPITVGETYTPAHWTSAVVGDDVRALKSAINAQVCSDINSFVTYEVGTINVDNGQNVTSSKTIRMKDQLHLNGTYIFRPKNGFRFRVGKYGNSWTLLNDWSYVEKEYTFSDDNIRAWMNQDGVATPTVSDSANLEIIRVNDFVSDDIVHIANSLENNGFVDINSTIEYEVGTINDETGGNTTSAKTIRTKNRYNINGAYVFKPLNGYRYKIGKYSGGTYSLVTGWTKNERKFSFNGEVVRICINDENASSASVSESENLVIYKDNAFQNYTNILTTVANSEDTYFGQKINLNHRFAKSLIGSMPGGQAGCIFGEKVFRFNADGTFAVYNAITSEVIKNGGTLDSVAPHCNSACFGKEHYSETDDFPLLYVNSYNDASLPKGTCYVFRVENDYTTTLVQTITIGFTTDSIWTDGSGDTRTYGNFCVDSDNEYLYAYTLLDTTKVTRFFRFALPALASGNVTLSQNDILARFDCDRFPYIQDTCCHNGVLYLCSGQGTSGDNGYIHVVDPIQKCEVSRINLYKSSFAWEPEFVDVKDDALWIGGVTYVYSLRF